MSWTKEVEYCQRNLALVYEVFCQEKAKGAISISYFNEVYGEYLLAFVFDEENAFLYIDNTSKYHYTLLVADEIPKHTKKSR